MPIQRPLDYLQLVHDSVELGVQKSNRHSFVATISGPILSGNISGHIQSLVSYDSKNAASLYFSI